MITNSDLFKIESTLHLYLPREQVAIIMSDIREKLNVQMDPSRPGWNPNRTKRG